jgi:hypothetical protein
MRPVEHNLVHVALHRGDVEVLADLLPQPSVLPLAVLSGLGND